MRRQLYQEPMGLVQTISTCVVIAALFGLLIYALTKPSYCESSGNTEKIAPGFVYKAKVRVKDGFYKGYVGELTSQSYATYRFAPGEYCHVPQYEVSLDDAGYYTTNQSNLELIE